MSTRQRQGVATKISSESLVFRGAASSVIERLFVVRPLIIYVRIHTIDISGRHKIRKYKKLNFIFSWTRSLIKPLVSLQKPIIIFQPQVAATCGHHK